MLRGVAVAWAIAGLAVCVPGIATAAKTKRSGTGSCAGASAVASDDASRAQALQAMLCIVNVERARRGLAALRVSSRLESAALRHSTQMVAAKFVGHRSANGDTVRARVRRTGYIRRSRFALLGETLTWGTGMFATPRELVTAMMQSAAHRRTILDRRFRDVGIGFALGAPEPGVAGRAATVTLDFGRR